MAATFDFSPGNCIRLLKGDDAGLCRMEVFLRSYQYSLHRHDSYAIGVTVSGVQCFSYRGAAHRAVRGQIHVLFPDEPHDGAAGTDEGFSYRIVHIDPALLQDVLNGRPLPFVKTPVLNASTAWTALMQRLWDPDAGCDDVWRAEIAVDIVDRLEAETPQTPPPKAPSALPLATLCRVREAIREDAGRELCAADLEALAGLDRWNLARGFRIAFGTSMSRFRAVCQLRRAQALIETGTPLADAALEAGFADQSHMTRRFRSILGLSPRQYAVARRPY